jgi:hypothetical protein
MPLPWSARKQLGFLRAYRDTLALAVSEPRQYSAAALESSRFDAWSFGTLTFAISSAIAFAGLGLATIWLGSAVAASSGASFPGWLMGLAGVFYWLCACFGFWFGTLVLAFLLRLSCRLFSVPLRTGGLWRMIMFAFGPCLFSWVPVLGIGAWVYAVVLMVFGVSERGRVSGGRASAAVLIPIGLSVGTLVLVWIALTVFALMHGHDVS